MQPTVPPMWGRCRQAYTLCHSRTCVCKAMLFRQRLHVAAWHCGNGRSEDVYGPIPAADPSTSIRTTEVTASDSFSSMRISDSSQPFNAFKFLKKPSWPVNKSPLEMGQCVQAVEMVSSAINFLSTAFNHLFVTKPAEANFLPQTVCHELKRSSFVSLIGETEKFP